MASYRRKKTFYKKYPYRRYSKRNYIKKLNYRINKMLSRQEVKEHYQVQAQQSMFASNDFNMSPTGHLRYHVLHDNIPQGAGPHQRVGIQISPVNIDLRLTFNRNPLTGSDPNSKSLPWSYRVVLLCFEDTLAIPPDNMFQLNQAQSPIEWWNDINAPYAPINKFKKKVLYDKVLSLGMTDDMGTQVLKIKRKIPSRYHPSYQGGVANRKIILYLIGGPAAKQQDNHDSLTYAYTSKLSFRDT